MTKEQLKASKEFVKELKIYFSSLSARGAKYLFLNVAGIPRSFVITNGDYELLTGYVPVLLGIHLVTFKESNFYESFLDFLNFKIDKPYIIRISQLTKAFKDNGAHELDVIYDQYQNMQVIVNSRILTGDDKDVEDVIDDSQTEEVVDLEENPFVDNSKFETITFKSADICGQLVDNYHALGVLEDVVIDMNDKKAFLEQENVPHYETSITPDEEIVHSNYYRISIELDKLSISSAHTDVYTILIDGLDVPSLKEFVRKREQQNVTMLIWRPTSGSIQHMATYDDSQISVKSTRPFLAIFPLTKEKL